jgi:ATP-binding cassette, subfamily B, heavy metal transporter
MNLPAPPNNARRAPEWGALRDLAPHLWPAGDLAVRGRVLLALALLAGSKFATVYVATVQAARGSVRHVA